MSFQGLHIGSSGIAASQRALETAAHNLANVNTPGYSRQRVEQTTAEPVQWHRASLGVGDSGMGVMITSIGRRRDPVLDLAYRDQRTASAGTEARAEFASRAEAVLGPLDNGIPGALDDFFNAWEELSQAPQDLTRRSRVLDATGTLTRWFNSAAAGLERLQEESTQQVALTVDRVNELADGVAALNDRIVKSLVRGDAPNDLLDQRDVMIDELAGLTGASVRIDENGAARVSIGNVPLVDNRNAYHLEAGTDGLAHWEVDGRAVGATGTLGALQEQGTATAVALLDDLDEIANELRTLVNTTHAAGTGLDGQTGLDLLSGTGAANLSLAAGIGTRDLAASAAGQPADGNHALVLGNLRRVAGTGGDTVGAMLLDYAGQIANAASRGASEATTAQGILADLDNRRLAESGVSIDEELTDMLRYQRAFDASARVVTVIDQMLERLINGTGATR